VLHTVRTVWHLNRAPQHKVYHSALRASTHYDYHTYSHTYATAIDPASKPDGNGW